jgi:hypothetical protein
MNLFVERKPDNIMQKKEGGDVSINYTPYIALALVVVGIIILVVYNKSSFMPMPERDDLIAQFSVADEFKKIHNTQDQFFN